MFCSKCGNKIIPGSSFCEKCGEKVVENGVTQTEVVLEEIGINKIQVIKVYKDVTGIGLKEAKEAVDAVENGTSVKINVNSDSVSSVIAQFRKAGAKVIENVVTQSEVSSTQTECTPKEQVAQPDQQQNYQQMPPVSEASNGTMPQGETVFCKQCGQKIPKDAAFCEKCGAPVKTIYTTQPTPGTPAKQRPKGKTNNIFFILVGIIAVIIIINLFGSSDVDYIASVKQVSPSYLTSATYEQLAEKCLESPKWKEREGTGGSHYVDIIGYSKPDGKKIEFTVRIDPTDDPEMFYYTPSKILIDGTGGGEDDAATFLLSMTTVYESGDVESLLDTYYGWNLMNWLFSN